MHRARAARPRGFDSLPSQNPDPGRCPLSFSAGSSKIKIRTSSRHKANLALWRDEVRILIFDDPAELSPYWSGNNPHPCGLLHKYRVSEHIHYFTNTLEVLQQCNIFKFMA